jgi:hypothetical protein
MMQFVIVVINIDVIAIANEDAIYVIVQYVEHVEGSGVYAVS